MMDKKIEMLERPETEKEKEIRVSPELQEICLDVESMDYITSSTDEVAERSQSEKIKTIHERVKQIKLSEKMGVKHMQRWEEKIMDREEGRREGTLEILYELVEKGLVTLDYALEKTGLSEVEFLQMMRERNVFIKY